MKYYITEISKSGNVALDDTILLKGSLTTAGSKMLYNFKPLFSAEVADRVEKAGYEIKGKLNVGEFGFDLLGETSYYGEKEETLKLPAAEAVKNGDVKYALSVELNGSNIRGAALSETVFVKPTFGTASRYGIVPCACSAEQVGVHANTVKDAAEMLSVIAGYDEKDGTCYKTEKYEYSVNGDVKGKKVCIPRNYLDKCSEEVKEKVISTAEALEKIGVEVAYIDLSALDCVQIAWQILMCAESCNNLSRYDGVKFGHRTEKYKDIEELYIGSRTEGLGFLAKAVILYGSDVLSKGKYFEAYDKSLKARRFAKNYLEGVFPKYDVILAPACSKTEYKEATAKTVYEESYFTSLADALGLPAVAVGGVQLIGDSFGESKLFSLASKIEEAAK